MIARRTATRCPDWCAGGHHCEARLRTGAHVSTPEVFDTDICRVVATRYGGHSAGGHVQDGHLELRLVIPVPRGLGVGYMRALIAAACNGIAAVVAASKS